MMESDALIEQENTEDELLQEESAEITTEMQQSTEITEGETARAAQGEAAYKDRYYLRYCGGKRTAPLDLSGTKAFLQGAGQAARGCRQGTRSFAGTRMCACCG